MAPQCCAGKARIVGPALCGERVSILEGPFPCVRSSMLILEGPLPCVCFSMLGCAFLPLHECAFLCVRVSMLGRALLHARGPVSQRAFLYARSSSARISLLRVIKALYLSWSSSLARLPCRVVPLGQPSLTTSPITRLPLYVSPRPPRSPRYLSAPIGTAVSLQKRAQLAADRRPRPTHHPEELSGAAHHHRHPLRRGQHHRDAHSALDPRCVPWARGGRHAQPSASREPL